MDILQQIEKWHSDARPVITDDSLRIAVAVHIEEFLEMLSAIEVKAVDVNEDYIGSTARFLAQAESLLRLVMLDLKENWSKVVLPIADRQEFLDGLADQIVTAVGCGVAAGMNVPEAVNRVQASNDSKRDPVTGKFFFDDQGKITKPNWYRRPDLSGLF